MIVVVDTNVLVSGLIAGNTPPPYIMDAWLDDVFQLAMSAETHAELLDVLERGYWARRLVASQTNVSLFKEKIESNARFYTNLPLGPFPIVDPKDEKFLAVAQAAHADYLISGDNHFKEIGSFMGTIMLTPRQFMDMLENGGAEDLDESLDDLLE